MSASLARDLPRAYVDLILPLIPEAAPEILTLSQHGNYEELYLLRGHAPLLWRCARAQFLERLSANAGMVPVVPTLAKVADTIPPSEREALEAAVARALDAEVEPEDRLDALLAWSRYAHPDQRASMEREALALFERVESVFVSRALAHAGADFLVRHGDDLNALLEPHLEGSHASSILFARMQHTPREQRQADTRRLLALPKPAADFKFVVYALLEKVPFEWLESAAERVVASLSERRDRIFASERLAPYASDTILDRLVEWGVDPDLETWARAEILAAVAAHHPRRAEVLRPQIHSLLERVVGDGKGAHRMSPGDVPEGADEGLLRARAAANASPVLHAEARRSIQERALRLLADVASRTDEYLVGGFPWDVLGGGLEPSLRPEAVRVVTTLRHRPAALQAMGEMVAAFPASERHLGLVVLSRLGDRSTIEALPAAVAALRAAARTRPTRTARRPLADVSLAASAARTLDAYLTSSRGFYDDRLEPLCAALPLEAAREFIPRAQEASPGSARLRFLLALAAAPALLGRPERSALVAEALTTLAEDRGRVATERLVTPLGDLAAEDAPTWRARLADVFARRRFDGEDDYLKLVTVLAPVLAQLGGVPLVEALAAKVQQPPPVPTFARPWARAGARIADA